VAAKAKPGATARSCIISGWRPFDRVGRIGPLDGQRLRQVVGAQKRCAPERDVVETALHLSARRRRFLEFEEYRPQVLDEWTEAVLVVLPGVE
jgi:hypothetical protein